MHFGEVFLSLQGGKNTAVNILSVCYVSTLVGETFAIIWYYQFQWSMFMRTSSSDIALVCEEA